MRAQRNLVDAALAWIRADQDLDPAIAGRSVTTTRADVDLGDEVWKAGRTTGVTRGRVTAIALDQVAVDYSDARDGSLIYSFDDQIEIRGDGATFSRGGDSGSLIVDTGDVAVGLLFAGSDATGVTFANPIETVLARTRSALLD